MEAAQIDAARAELEDSDWRVRQAAVEALGQHKAVLAQHAAAVAAKLEDSNGGVRYAAMEALGKHEAVLASSGSSAATASRPLEAGPTSSSTSASSTTLPSTCASCR